MTHREPVRELRACNVQCPELRCQRLSRRPRLIALNLECQQLAVGKLGYRRLKSRIGADLQRRRQLLQIAGDGIALKRQRNRVMDIAHQQIERRTQPRSDEVT